MDTIYKNGYALIAWDIITLHAHEPCECLDDIASPHCDNGYRVSSVSKICQPDCWIFGLLIEECHVESIVESGPHRVMSSELAVFYI